MERKTRPKQIIVIGSTNPEKEIQDSARVFSRGGCNPALRARDYKEPVKVVRQWKRKKSK